MKPETFDVVVLGVGGMGAAALAHLAQRGCRVLGIDQHEIGHGFGSSHGISRVIRKVYFEDPRYVPLLERSYELWRQLEVDVDARLLHITGCLNLGTRDHVLMGTVLHNARLHALPHEVLKAQAVRERFPAFHINDDVIGVYEADAGILPVEQCTKAHVTIASRFGAEVREHTEVKDVELGARVRITTHEGVIDAAAVVFACGPWSPTLPFMKTIAHRLVATRQVQTWFPSSLPHFGWGQFPVFIHFFDGTSARRGGVVQGRNFYGMPPFGGAGVKIARHGGGVATTPDSVQRTPMPADEEEVRSYVRQALPELDGPTAAMEVCMYTMTPDEHFVVGHVPNHQNAVVLGGFSGHGYKMATVMGEIAADLVVDGRTRHDIGFFDPNRFQPLTPSSLS